MKLFGLEKLVNIIKDTFTSDAKKAEQQQQRDKEKLAEISEKAHAHLKQREEAGLPKHGRAEFKPGHIVSTKFWGKLQNDPLHHFSQAASQEKADTPKLDLREIDFTSENVVSIREAALARKAKEDELLRQRQTFAGVPMYKLDDAFQKVVDATAENDDTIYQVAELDFETGNADVSDYTHSQKTAERQYKIAI